MQFSLQPRLHLELGLLRLVHAGRIVAIEEALANAGGGDASTGGGAPSGGSPRRATPTASSAKPTAAPPQSAAPLKLPEPPEPPPPPPEPPPAEPAPQLSGWKGKLHAALTAKRMVMIADAVEVADVEEAEGELRFKAGREYSLALKSKELAEVVRELGGPQWKAVYVPGESNGPETSANGGADDDEARERALSHPEVQRYREVFPDSQVRTVRNLKQ